MPSLSKTEVAPTGGLTSLVCNCVASNPIQNREMLWVRQREKTFVAATLSVATWPGRQWVVLFVNQKRKSKTDLQLSTRKHAVSLLPSPFCVPFPFFAFFSQNFGLPFVCVYTMRAVGLLRSRNYNSPWYE